MRWFLTDFVNLKIKLAQSFKCVYKDMMYVCIFIRMNDHIYKYLYLYYMTYDILTKNG
jgi:hypothetical protein